MKMWRGTFAHTYSEALFIIFVLLSVSELVAEKIARKQRL